MTLLLLGNVKIIKVLKIKWNFKKGNIKSNDSKRINTCKDNRTNETSFSTVNPYDAF